MTVKTAVSRFQIHDELTAPDESAPLIKTIQAAGGAVTKFVGVLAGSPAVLRAYTRMGRIGDLHRFGIPFQHFVHAAGEAAEQHAPTVGRTCRRAARCATSFAEPSMRPKRCGRALTSGRR